MTNNDDAPRAVPIPPANSLKQMAEGVYVDPDVSMENLLIELDEVMERPDLNTGDERAIACVRALAFWARRAAVVMRLTGDRARKAEQFLGRAGYRRCDIPACNCGSWHSDAKSETL